MRTAQIEPAGMREPSERGFSKRETASVASVWTVFVAALMGAAIFASPGVAAAQEEAEADVEMASDSNAVVAHVSEMGPDYALKQLIYKIGDRVVFESRDANQLSAKDIQIFSGAISPGLHAFYVEAIYEDTRKRGVFEEIFAYADKPKSKVKYSAKINFVPGRYVVINVRGFEQEAVSSWLDKPALTARARTCNDPTCSGALAAGVAKLPPSAKQASTSLATRKQLGGSSNLAIVHENRLGAGYRLAALGYRVDGNMLLLDNTEAIRRSVEVPIYLGKSPAGKHLIEVEATYERVGEDGEVVETQGGVSETVKAKWQIPYTAPTGRWAVVRIVNSEDASATEWRERPTFKGQARICNNAECTDGAAAAVTVASSGAATTQYPTPAELGEEAYLILSHENEMGSQYDLDAIAYSINGDSVFEARGTDARKTKLMTIREARIPAGQHKIETQLRYLRSGGNFFERMVMSSNTPPIRLTWGTRLKVPAGKYAVVKFIGFEKTEGKLDWKDKGDVRAEVRICDTPTCEGVDARVVTPTGAPPPAAVAATVPAAEPADEEISPIADLGGDVKLQVTYENQLGVDYIPRELKMSIDRTPVLARDDEALAEVRQIIAYDGFVPAGKHTIRVQAVSTGGSRVIPYLQKVRLRKQWPKGFEFEAGTGKYVFVKFVAYEKTGIDLEWKQRPGLRAEIRVCDEPTCANTQPELIMPGVDLPEEPEEVAAAAGVAGDLGGDAHLGVNHLDQVGSSYQLAGIVYTVDKAMVANQSESDINGQKEITVYRGRIGSGLHQVRMQAIYRGATSGIYTLASNLRVRVQWNAPIRIPEGKYGIIDFITYEEGGVFEKWENRPRVRAEVRICDDFDCEGVTAVALNPGFEQSRVSEGLGTASLEDIAALLDGFEAQLRGIREEMRFLKEGYTEPDPESRLVELQKRREQGEMFFAAGTYDRAAISLYEYVEAPETKDDPKRVEATYLLAESLYETGDHVVAQQYYEKLLAKNEITGERRGVAVVQLIEIADLLEDRPLLDKYVEMYNKLPPEEQPSDGSYTIGRAYYRRGDLKRAKDYFSMVREGQPGYQKSRYFLGAILVKQGKPQDALPVFETVIETTPANEEDQRLVDLSRLAVARVYYDEGKLEESAEAYKAIPVESDLYQTALYEQAWMLVRDKKFDDAANMLELYLLLEPSEFIKAEGRLLRGDLYMRKQEYERAQGEMQTVSEEFVPIYDRISQSVDDTPNAQAYFHQLTDADEDDEQLVDPLPPEAVAEAKNNPTMKRALGVTDNLENMEETIKRAEKLVAKLNRMLNGPDRIEVFGKLSEGNARGLALDVQLLEIEAGLAEVLDLLVAPFLKGEELEELKAVRTERVNAMRENNPLPSTFTEMKEEKALQIAELQRVSGELARIAKQVEFNKKRYKIVKEYYAKRKDTIRKSEDGERRFKQQLSEELQIITLHGDNIEEIQDEIDIEEEKYNYSANMRRERPARDRLAETTNADIATTEVHLDKLEGERRLLADRATKLRIQIESLREGIEAYREALAAIAERDAAKMSGNIAKESSELLTHRTQLARVQRDNEQVSSGIAIDALKKVRGKYYNVVLQSDIGMLDVAWQRKSTRSEKITDLTLKQNKEVEVLNEEFEEVRKGADAP